MGDRFRTSKPAVTSLLCNQPPTSTQPGHPFVGRHMATTVSSTASEERNSEFSLTLGPVTCSTAAMIYTVSQKTTLTWHAVHQLVLIIFGRNVAEWVSYRIIIYFQPSLTNVCTLPGETWTPEIVCLHPLKRKYIALPTNTERRSNYHSATAEPHFVTRKIKLRCDLHSSSFSHVSVSGSKSLKRSWQQHSM